MNNLLLTMLDKAGVPAGTLGDARQVPYLVEFKP